MPTGFRLICLLLSLGIPLIARVYRASLNGAVTDPSGATVAGGSIEISFAATGFKRTDLSGDAGTYVLPALPIGLVPAVSLIPPGGQTLNNWINPAAFAIPAHGKWGNVGRIIIRAPGSWQLDTALTKRNKITERVGLEFRAGTRRRFQLMFRLAF